MALAAPASLLVLLPRMNMRGPMLAGNPNDCFIHIVTAKEATFPNPRAELVTEAKFPLPPWVGFDERFRALLGLVNPATPDNAAPWRLVATPDLLSICIVTFTPPPLVSLGVVVPEPASSNGIRNLRVGP